MRLPLPRWLLALLAIAALAIGVDNLERRLANPDEGRYSEISREMVESGDWITPRLNGLKYFEKPPLQYWATAAAFEALGQNEYAARLYVGLCGLLTVLVVGYTGLRLAGPETGLAAMLVLVSSPFFIALGGIVTLDMGLTLWTTATLCAFLLAEEARERAREQRRWMLAAWAAMALAMLSKGLVGIVFAGAAVFFAIVLRREASVLKRMHWGLGLAIFLAIAAPWFVAVSIANPEFAWFFFVHEHFERFLSTAHRRVEPWWYFVPIVIIGFLPWMCALPSALAHAWRRDDRAAGPWRIAIAYGAFVLVFFSASSSKLPAYVLPMFPPIALVLGRYLVEADPRKLSFLTAPVVLVGLALAVLAWRYPETARDDWTRALYFATRPWALSAAALLLASTIAATLMLRRGRRWLAMAAFALATVLMLDCFENAYEIMSPRQSGYVVAEKMKPFLGPATRLYSVEHYDQSLPFYIGRTLTLVDYEDEFALGEDLEPEKYLTLYEFVADWLRPGEALAIMQPETYQWMRALGLPMQLLHDDARRVLVRKP